jgi:hypothetical protein
MKIMTAKCVSCCKLIVHPVKLPSVQISCVSQPSRVVTVPCLMTGVSLITRETRTFSLTNTLELVLFARLVQHSLLLLSYLLVSFDKTLYYAYLNKYLKTGHVPGTCAAGKIDLIKKHWCVFNPDGV